MFHVWISAATDTAATVAAAAKSSLTAMSIGSKGLFTTLFGLVGVFLVLTLFFISIKLLQRSPKKPSETKE